MPFTSASPAPLASEVVAFEKQVQATKLELPALRQHRPQLVFARGALALLTRDALLIYDARDFHELLRETLDGPRAVLALADGGLLALGARELLLWQPGFKRTKKLARPSLLPGAEVFADAQQPDRLWVFDPRGRELSPTLVSYRLVDNDGSLPLPEQTVELRSPSGGVLGLSREGVWLYFTSRRLERLAPGGLRLPGVPIADMSPPTWLLPARRLDQALWLDESGQASLVLLTPTFKRLGAGVSLAGRVLTGAVGDEGRLAAFIVVTAPGPRFELELRDAALGAIARVALPGDEPTGRDDWVQAVIANQNLAAAPHEPRLAVGGPGRLLIFDGRGNRIFSINYQ